MAAGCSGVAAGFGSSSVRVKLGNAHVPGGIGSVRMSPSSNVGTRNHADRARDAMAQGGHGDVDRPERERAEEAARIVDDVPGGVEDDLGRPSLAVPPGRTATKRAIRGFEDANAMSVGTTVAHARRKNRHWSISVPEAVPGLAGRSGSSGAGDIRKRCGLGSLAVTKSGMRPAERDRPRVPIERQALQERLGHGGDGGDPGARVQAADGDVDHQQRGVRLAEAPPRVDRGRP